MNKICLVLMAGTAIFLFGCSTTDSGNQASVERGPQGTIAYRVRVESNEPGVRIEVNKEYVGTTPLALKIFGDKDGTFHFFDSPDYVVRAIPVKPGQNLHSKYFRTGDMFTGEDKIPKRIFFDMSQPEKSFVEGGPAPRW
jgi:hypothetical protein